MKIISSKWSKDDVGFYILPFMAFSYGDYGNRLWIGWFKYLFTIIIHSDVQNSRAYCNCGNELLQDSKSKVYEHKNYTNIICSECNLQSSWDLDAPVPLLLASSEYCGVAMSDRNFKDVCKQVENETAKQVISDYMLVFDEFPISEEAWFKVSKINGKYLN